jgi:hypothetical protein
MTEKELINRAKIFRSNCEMNGDKISFADACKVVLFAAFIDYSIEGDTYIVRDDLVKIYRDLVRDKKPWWKLF